MKKRKRLTIAEKKINTEIRSELRAEGIIPPIKDRLNRKKFAEEIIEDYKENLKIYEDSTYLHQAIECMLPDIKYKGKVNPEQVGVLKVLKIAMEIKKFMKDKLENGENKYNPYDLYKNVVDPIIKL